MTPPAATFRQLNDGYLTGTILTAGHTCEVCNMPQQQVLRLTRGPKLPDGIEPQSTILWKRHNFAARPSNRTLIYDLGITCGCYAKFHRQIAHIRDRQGFQTSF